MYKMSKELFIDDNEVQMMKTELYSLKQNRVYTLPNATRKKVGHFYILADTDGNFLVERIR